jgi:hypothetical protein
MRALPYNRSSSQPIDMNIAFALSEDVVTTKDEFGESLILEVSLESDRSVITIRSQRTGVLLRSDVSGPLYEAFPKAIREAFYKWQQFKRDRQPKQ